jgi:RHS repeat-associated protein
MLVQNRGDALSITYLPNRRSREARTDAGGVAHLAEWSYDGLGRLAGETMSSGTPGGGFNFAEAYRHDLLGNRQRVVRAEGGLATTTTSVYDRLDRLRQSASDSGTPGNSSDDVVTSYGYQAGGSDTSQQREKAVTTAGVATGTTAYAYDVMGRMSQVSITEGGATTTAAYAYDTSGIRISRTEGGHTTLYHVDPMNPTGYAQVLEEGTDTSGDGELQAGEVARTFALAGRVLAQATATTVLNLLADARGSTRATLDAATNAATASFAYDAGGSPIGFTLGGAPTPVLYAGQYFDATSGLSYNRARWYDPSTRSFTRVDDYRPGAGDAANGNLLMYAGGDPVNASDPSGMLTTTELGVTGGTSKLLMGLLFLHLSSVADWMNNSFGPNSPLDILHHTVPQNHRDKAHLSADVYNPEPSAYGDWLPVSPGELTALEVGATSLSIPASGLHSVLYRNTISGEHTLVFRGTENATDWTFGNTQAFDGGLWSESQYNKADRIVDNINAALGGDLTFAGHSLGGGLASAAAVSTGGSAATFNAAGLSYLTILGLGAFFGRAPRVDAYRVDGDWLTHYQEHNGVTAGIMPDAYGYRWTLPKHPDDHSLLTHGMTSVLLSLGEA